MGCDDGNNCMTGDRCDGQGTCAGTTVPCTPGQCQMANGCSSTGVCQFTPTTGGTWDAGVGTPAQCMAGSCMLPSLFHFPVSNFAELPRARR